VLRYLVRRILLTIPVLLGVATLVFSLIHLVPGDPAQAMLGEGAAPQDIAELRKNLGLDRPLLEQYAAFLAGIARGDLGTSLRTGRPVTTQLLERVPADPWGRAFRLRVVDGGAKQFAIESSGADGEFATADDGTSKSR